MYNIKRFSPHFRGITTFQTHCIYICLMLKLMNPFCKEKSTLTKLIRDSSVWSPHVKTTPHAESASDESCVVLRLLVVQLLSDYSECVYIRCSLFKTLNFLFQCTVGVEMGWGGVRKPCMRRCIMSRFITQPLQYNKIYDERIHFYVFIFTSEETVTQKQKPNYKMFL